VIQEHIKKPLADEILFGKLTRGGHVRVTLKDGKLVFDFDETAAAPAAAESEDRELAEVATADAPEAAVETPKPRKPSKPAVPSV
jgi:hypothetical protein